MRSASSAGVRGCSAESRVSKTPALVWRREEVARKMFSAWKTGRVERKARKPERKRMPSEKEVLGGRARI